MSDKQKELEALKQTLKSQRKTQNVYLYVTIGTFIVSCLFIFSKTLISGFGFGCFVLLVLGSGVFNWSIASGSKQIQAFKSKLSTHHNDNVDAFELIYETTVIARQHEQWVLRRKTLWLFPKIFIGILYIAGFGVITFQSISHLIKQFQASPQITEPLIFFSEKGVPVLLSCFALLFCLAIFYKMLRAQNTQRKLTKVIHDEVKSLQAQRPAAIGSISLTHEQTTAGAMSITHAAQDGALTNAQAHDNITPQAESSSPLMTTRQPKTAQQPRHSSHRSHNTITPDHIVRLTIKGCLMPRHQTASKS